ncbi:MULTISPECIES: hypothetical protein [unclassified Candidatus Frackibacter]|uniref:hypothetical protein n=1 Tax=unclassified Candidatus Frackibacter TaxID=2648818 RepID=UPI0007976D8D|nr:MULTISPECIES: hypothetical protein [unclassified Candidatus Frackibacter]KXS43718.1 MAG: hypothetical protein AWU54_935 [Candidatus Frackibacter sp. T328-2]SDC21029.1 hypothetical protein SAMN04515661_10422 [Candidatus Frackibacter sp. WG11]SEM50772.1 hypothetical protein SAMN04488698_105143 [Candidatus Frackibacter sp. WG12]SFL52114.1 hypothetical protein SAMN04488699_104140 [Candidatus Frackibacter sp. WG13]
MLKVLGLAAIFIMIILFEVPSLVKNEEWKELTVFSLLLFIGLVLSIAGMMGFNFSQFYN